MCCTDPLNCQIKARSWLKGTKQIDVLQKQIQQLIEQGAFIQVEEKKHADKQQFNRSVSLSQIKDVIECGEVIYEQDGRILMLGYVKTGLGQYRPLHVALNLTKETIVIRTVYDPRSMSWLWNDDFSKKICFCKG